jgi:hypothetical protein
MASESPTEPVTSTLVLGLPLASFSAAGLMTVFLAAEGEDATAFFFVEDAAVFGAGFEVGLVAGDDGAEFTGGEFFAAVLDAGVAGDDAVLEGEFEVGEWGGFVDEEGVVLDDAFFGVGGVGRGFAGDGAVFDAPEGGVAFPAGEVFAVEEVFGVEGGEGQ